MEKSRKKRGFTLIELMVVILIIAVLAALSTPIFRDRTRQSKWSEAAATAGAIRSATRAAFAEDQATIDAWADQALDAATMATLGFQTGDLTGSYFAPGQFVITSVDSTGNAVITVTSPGASVPGSAVLNNTGWTYTAP